MEAELSARDWYFINDVPTTTTTALTAAPRPENGVLQGDDGGECVKDRIGRTPSLEMYKYRNYGVLHRREPVDDPALGPPVEDSPSKWLSNMENWDQSEPSWQPPFWE